MGTKTRIAIGFIVCTTTRIILKESVLAEMFTLSLRPIRLTAAMENV